MDDQHIDTLIKFFVENDLLKSISSGEYYFDEPRFDFISTDVNMASSYFEMSDFFLAQSIYGGGSSYFDRKDAFVKALGETIERICQEVFRKSTLLYDSYTNLHTSAIDPALNGKNLSMREAQIGWIVGKYLATGKDTYVPAQYAHYNYTSYKKEPPITALISTGGAFGWTHDETLLRGLYELIERDAFTTTYLIKAPVRHINVDTIEDKRIQHIQTSLKKNLLEWHLFDITDDLEIPVFLSLLIDRTGKGPAVTAGACSRLDPYPAIINSIAEASMSRPWVRASFAEAHRKEKRWPKQNQKVKERLDRAFYWYPRENISKLNFWLKSPFTDLSYKFHTFKTAPEELKFLQDTIGHEYPSVYCDLTHPAMKSHNFHVYKVINPHIHALYLDEDEKSYTINPERLRRVAAYFSIKNYQINPTPHPFL